LAPSDWHISDGPDRPLWEPVRLVDFADERLEALKRLRERLRAMPHEVMDDSDLAMHAILEYLFARSTVRLDQAKAEAIRLATQRLPDPGAGKRRRLRPAQRDDVLVAVGHAWTLFIRHNFPLDPPRSEA
jgi:hypothetical protein